MQKPNHTEFPAFFGKYIALVSDTDFFDVLEKSLTTTVNIFASIPSEKHNFRYAEGKWTIKEILIHIIDTERIMSYRALAIGRGDKTALPGFDENTYVENVDVTNRPMESLLDEFKTVRQASIHLFRNFSETALTTIGSSNGNSMSTQALGYIIIGHVLHHINVLEERYL